jgi:phage shock protein A
MFKTTEQVFEMLHGAAIDALERMEAERDTMRARAEAAEAEAASLRAQLAQARADGEASGAARERAAVVAWLRETVWAADEADYIERGDHIGAAGGAR